MVDNVAITAGSGTPVRTDEIAGIHYQVVKLADGAADSTAMIGGDAANGLDVDVTRIAAGDNNIGNVDVVTLPALAAGTALIGKVSIDQATANANEVVVKSGTVTAVTAITNALPAGTNAIGKLAANSGVDIGDVDVTSIAAGENHLGMVGGVSTLVDATVASAAAAYASGDIVGAELTLANCARVNGGTGKITGVTVIDSAAQSVAAELWIFDTTVTEPADNAAWSISDANANTLIAVIPLSNWYASALNSVSPNGNLSIPFKCVGGATSLYMCYVNRGAPTHIANGILVRIFIDQD